MAFSTKLLTTIVRQHLPDAVEDVVFTPIATGKFNTSYFVDAGSRRMVLRVAPPADATFVFYEKEMMRQEPELHHLLRTQTKAPVAAVLGYDTSHQLIDRDYILMERLPGKPWSEMLSVDDDAILYQVGVYLAQTHQIQAGSYGYLGAHHPMSPQASWVEAFAVMWHKLIDDVVGVGYYDEQESRTLRLLLDRHLSHFERAVPASLLHMDIWHQNILVDAAGIVTGIVDWDRAVWGDPEIEFAVLDYCNISRPAFWKGYGKQRDESASAQVRQVFYLLYELQKYIVIYHGRTGEPQRARKYHHHVWDIVRHRLL